MQKCILVHLQNLVSSLEQHARAKPADIIKKYGDIVGFILLLMGGWGSHYKSVIFLRTTGLVQQAEFPSEMQEREMLIVYT